MRGLSQLQHVGVPGLHYGTNNFVQASVDVHLSFWGKLLFCESFLSMG